MGAFTLADFGLVLAAVFTEAGAGNPITTPSRFACSFPNGTGNGDQLINTDPINSAQCMVSINDETAARHSRLTHTSDISKRVRTTDFAAAAANGRVRVAIFAPPPGLFV